jgi:hypothetical protein
MPCPPPSPLQHDLHGMKSTTLPALSTGNLGMSLDQAVRFMLTGVLRFLQGGRAREGGPLRLRRREASTPSNASSGAGSASARARLGLPTDLRAKGALAKPRGLWPSERSLRVVPLFEQCAP